MGSPQQDEEALRHEAFIANVLEVRSPGESKAWTRILFETAGGAALIAVVAGGIATHLLTNRFSERQKQRDFQNALIALYSEHNLAEHAAFAKQRMAFLESTLELAGQTLTLSRNKIQSDAFVTHNEKGAPIPEIHDQIRQIRNDWNDVDVNWRKRQGALSPLMSHYFDHDAIARLRDVQTSVTGVLKCTAEHRRDSSTQQTSVCTELVSTAEESLERFAATAGQSKIRDWMSEQDIRKFHGLISAVQMEE